MKGCIVINSYFRPEEIVYQPRRLKDEFSSLGVEIDILENADFQVSEKGLYPDCREYAFCVFLDKDKYLMHALEESGLPLFNSRRAIEICDDKMTTLLALNGKIPMPKTIAAPLCYRKEAKIEESAVEKIASVLSLPVVVKESYGSRGTGVFLAESVEELKEYAEKLKCTPHLYQQFIKSSFGKDVRVIVVGGKTVGGMLRLAEGAFRANVACGARAETFPLSEKQRALAERTAEILGLDYCGIDFLLDEKGEFLLSEVNSNAFFCAFEETTRINVARLYAEHILKKLKC